MGTVAEDIRKIMNLEPFASPFSETFVPATHSLEAIRGAIDALEYGIFGYGVVAGAQIVEVGTTPDKAEFAVELLNPGGAIIPFGLITPGTYTIHRIRNGAKSEIYTHDAVAPVAGGRVELDIPYEFTSANWSPGDLFMVVFSGIYTTIDSTLTYFPDMILTGRISREEEIENILEYTTTDTLKNAIEEDLDSVYNRIGDPTGRTNYKSLYLMLELDDTANYNLDDILRTGYITAGENLGTGSIMERIGTIGNTSHNRSVLEGMGLPDDNLTTLYELLVTGYVTEGLAVKGGALIEKHNYIIDLIEDNAASVFNRIGAFDGDADPNGSIFLALGNPVTNSIWDAVQYINHVAFPTVPVAGSLGGFIASGGTAIGTLLADSRSIIDAIGHDGADILTRGLGNNIGNFEDQTNFKSLLAVLGGASFDTQDNSLYEYLVTGADTGTAPAIAENEDGSVLERLEFIQKHLIPDLSGLAFQGTVTAQEVGSETTEFYVAELEGYGDDFFNDEYWIQIIKAGAVAPEGEWQNVSDYTSTTGKFVVGAAFGANVDIDDEIIVVHENIYSAGAVDDAALGKNLDDDGTQSAIALLRSLIDRIGNVGASDIDALIDAVQVDIGDPSARGFDPSLEQMLGVPDDGNGSLGDRLGFAHVTHPFTVVENLRAILGTGLTSTQHLYGILGGYTLADSLKVATDVLLQQDLTTQTRDARSIAGYVEGIGIDASPDGYDSSAVTVNEDGSIFERLEYLQDEIGKIPNRVSVKEYLLGAAVALTGDPTVSTEAGTTSSATYTDVWNRDFTPNAGTLLSLFVSLHWTLQEAGGTGAAHSYWEIATGSNASPGAYVALTDVLDALAAGALVDGDRSGSIELIATVPFTIRLMAKDDNADGAANITVKSSSFVEYGYERT